MYNLNDLVSIMAKLRSPEGCPWDRRQTHQSLKPDLLEETYEVLDAIDNGSPADLQEELGDLLLQVVFHAQLAAEERQFNVNDVVSGLCKKLIRRHPHVFADATAEDVADVFQHWDAVKQQERQDANETDADTASTLASIPRTLPALMRAEKIQKRVARVGFDWPDPAGPLEKLSEELKELTSAVDSGVPPDIEDELGDLFFSLVNLSRFLNTSPELALDATNQKFVRRFQALEQLARSEGLALNTMSLEAMDALWERVKADEGSA